MNHSNNNSNYYNGVGTTVQWGEEQTWGAGDGTLTSRINFTSESVAVSVEKSSEETLIATKTESGRELTSISVGGSVSFNLNPSFAGLMFHASLGGTDTVTASTESGMFDHTFKLAGASDDLPSLQMVIDRKVSTKLYKGLTVSSMSLDCPAGEYVTGSIELQGKDETTGTLSSTIPAISGHSFKCVGAQMKVNNVVWDISSASFSLDNGIVESPNTYSSGLYSNQPTHGKRTVTISWDIPYKALIDAFKEDYLVTDSYCSVVLQFATAEGEKVVMTMPKVSIDTVTNNVGGSDLITASVSGIALQIGDTEPLTVVYTDSHEDAYSYRDAD